MRKLFVTLLLFPLLACDDVGQSATELEPVGRGPYSVASTNVEVLPEYAEIDRDTMHDILLGRGNSSGETRFITDILKHPEAAWVVDVSIPDEPDLYGPASGTESPVFTYVVYPSSDRGESNPYEFPYENSQFGVFEDMLAAGDAPRFANPDERYPLIVLAHGAPAHGIYDVGRAHNLASHGYIVAVLTYGDDRTVTTPADYEYAGFLRPLLTKTVIDSLLESDAFGDHIDVENIGIAGHSFGGFTSLAAAGGPFRGKMATVSDARIKAGSIAAPWVGNSGDSNGPFAFGPDNSGLRRVTIPIICFFGSKDKLTTSASILSAMRQLGGTRYVVELVDQPHIFEAGSWKDRDAWELLFFSAYLKHDAASLAKLEAGRSMKDGNEDIQLVDYQQLSRDD